MWHVTGISTSQPGSKVVYLHGLIAIGASIFIVSNRLLWRLRPSFLICHRRQQQISPWRHHSINTAIESIQLYCKWESITVHCTEQIDSSDRNSYNQLPYCAHEILLHCTWCNDLSLTCVNPPTLTHPPPTGIQIRPIIPDFVILKIKTNGMEFFTLDAIFTAALCISFIGLFWFEFVFLLHNVGNTLASPQKMLSFHSRCYNQQKCSQWISTCHESKLLSVDLSSNAGASFVGEFSIASTVLC